VGGAIGSAGFVGETGAVMQQGHASSASQQQQEWASSASLLGYAGIAGHAESYLGSHVGATTGDHAAGARKMQAMRIARARCITISVYRFCRR